MDFKKLKQVLSMRAFMPKYVDESIIKYNASTRHKMRGTDGNGKPASFSDEEKKAIKTGLKRFLKDIGYL